MELLEVVALDEVLAGRSEDDDDDDDELYIIFTPHSQ